MSRVKHDGKTRNVSYNKVKVPGEKSKGRVRARPLRSRDMKVSGKANGDGGRKYTRKRIELRERSGWLPGESGNGFDVKQFCKRFHIARTDLTRLTGYSLSAVDKWAKGNSPGGSAQKHLRELVRLFDAFSGLMEPSAVGEWMKASNPAFEGSTPLQVIERGEADRLWRMVYELESGQAG